jgi:peptidoglycan/LPS O-acetylase OafA/YrhL
MTAHTQPASERLEFPSVDILRGAAALSVVTYHVIEHDHWTSFPISGPLVWFRLGWMGVDLFLVISGFVISLSAAALLERFQGRAFLAEFALRRCHRIMPLYYVTCVLFVILIVPDYLVQWASVPNLLAHAVFLHNVILPYQGAIDGANWSVGLEVQFYVLCGLLAPWLWRARWWKVALAALAIAWLWRWAVLELIPYGRPGSAMLRFQLTKQLPGTLDEFGSGILLARLLRGPYGQDVLKWGNRWPVVPVLLAALAVTVLLDVFWTDGTFWDSTAMVIVWRSCCAISFTLVVFAFCCLNGRYFRAVTAPLRYLGTISYGIYLWHLLVIWSVQRIGWVGPQRALWTVLPATLVLAAGSWHLLEQPFLRRRRDRSAAPSAAPLAPVAAP